MHCVTQRRMAIVVSDSPRSQQTAVIQDNIQMAKMLLEAGAGKIYFSLSARHIICLSFNP
jgi:hypothetical protein